MERWGHGRQIGPHGIALRRKIFGVQALGRRSQKVHREQRFFMVRHLHPVARRMRRHTPPFGDPTGQRHVGVENIYGTTFDQITATPALHLALPGRDPDASGGSHLVHTAHLVVPVHGFLEPGDVAVSHATRKTIASATV